MPWPVHPNGLLGAQGDSDSYRIARSLRFNSADSAYLNRTFGSGSATTWTLSAWVKRSELGTSQYWFSGSLSSFSSYVGFESDNALQIQVGNGSSIGYVKTTALFRDPSAWYHIVAVCNTSSATSTVLGTTSDRLQLFVNGVQINSFSGSSVPSQNFSQNINTAVSHRLGGHPSGLYLGGYLAEVNFIDGQALTPSSFGETDAITGRWKAKAYSGTYGTNGFYLKFSDNSSLTTTSNVGIGKDFSGNANYWATNGISITAGAGNDSLVDSPTNYGTDTGLGGEVRGSYATNNPIDNSGGATLSNGNLDASISGLKSTRSSIAMTSGKWYCEVLVNSAGNPSIGILNSTASLSSWIGSSSGNTWGYYNDGTKNTGGTATSFGSTYTTNDIIGVAYDAGAKKIWFAKNGTWQASGNPAAGTNEAYSSITGSEIFFGGSNGGSATSCSLSFNFGQRPFAYTAPSGFKTLCTQNLTQPTIQKPSTAMDVVTYTGTGASQSISSLGFSPDLVWIKGRSGATDHAIYDSVRGTTLDLASNLTSAETTQSQGVTAFNSNGFTIGTLAKLNTNTSTYVGWSWDAGSTNSTNTSGSITSTVRVNPQAGFSIVSYTGTGANATVGHGLGVAPKMIIARNRNSSVAQNWQVYHSNLTSASFRLRLNTTDAQDSVSGIWNSTNPTSSVFSIGTETGVNESGKIFIAYCFAEIEGYSKFGSYTGNASTDGPFVWCGFRPRWVMSKSATGAYNWHLYDSARDTSNACTNDILPNSSGAEVTGSTYIDILSNGFKVRASDIGFNGSGATFIFAAFAESPFKYARAR